MSLELAQKSSAAKVYARSFFNYPELAFYWPDPSRRARYLEWYLGCAIEYGLRYGEVYTTPDVAGIAIWLPPGQTHFTTRRSILAGFLPTPFAVGIKRFFTQALKNENFVRKVHEDIMPRPHWYLWGIAVAPERQGKGIGKLLMQPGLDKADVQHLPCYLETHDDKNIAFYLERGFDLVRAEQVPGSDLRIWCFSRQPRCF